MISATDVRCVGCGSRRQFDAEGRDKADSRVRLVARIMREGYRRANGGLACSDACKAFVAIDVTPRRSK